MFKQNTGRNVMDVENTDIYRTVPDMARQTAIEQALTLIRIPPSTVWTGADTRNVLVLSAVPVGLALYESKMISTDARVKTFMQHEGPKWMPKNRGLLSLTSLANLGTVAPLGYASYLVYKLGGGMVDTQTRQGIILYGLTLLSVIGKIAATKNTDMKMITIGGLATTALAGWTAYAFYKVNDTAAYLMLPFTVWSAICTVPWVIRSFKVDTGRREIVTKRVRNPHGNRWNGTNTAATIAADGLNVSNNTNEDIGFSNHVFAEQPFPISGPQCRVDGFPGTICYYYEVKSRACMVGLSDGAFPEPYNLWIGDYSNSYAIPTVDGCYQYMHAHIAGERHQFELPEGVIPSRQTLFNINVYGCGLVLDHEDKLAIFFTFNGKLIGWKIPISPTVDRLFPSVTMLWKVSLLEANFGDDPAKPFQYDINTCPGLELDCV